MNCPADLHFCYELLRGRPDRFHVDHMVLVRVYAFTEQIVGNSWAKPVRSGHIQNCPAKLQRTDWSNLCRLDQSGTRGMGKQGC